MRSRRLEARRRATAKPGWTGGGWLWTNPGGSKGPIGDSPGKPPSSPECPRGSPTVPGALASPTGNEARPWTRDQAKANLETARAQLRKDRASLTYAKSNYERDRGLRETGVVSQDALDSDKSVYDQVLAQVGLDEATSDQRRAAPGTRAARRAIPACAAPGPRGDARCCTPNGTDQRNRSKRRC
jgi:hypothetical protein